MKKLLITAIALLAFTAGSQAQTNNRSPTMKKIPRSGNTSVTNPH